MRHHLTASRIALARLCLYWARPDVRLPGNEESRAATLGTAFHAVAEAETEEVNLELVDERFGWVVAKGVAEDLAGDELGEPERRQLARLVAAWREWWAQGLLTGAETEQACGLTKEGQGYRLERTGARDYTYAPDDSIPGTADVVAVWAPNDGSKAHLVVLDYKTGFGPHKLEDHRDQLVHLGSAIVRDEGGPAEYVRVGVAHVTVDGVIVDSEVLDPLDVAIHVEEMRELLEQLPTAEPRPGLHCDDMWCPARAVCPVTRNLLLAAQVDMEPRRHLPLVGPVTSNEAALGFLIAKPLLEAWLENRAAAVKLFADQSGGVRDDDGRVYAGRDQTRETVRLDVTGALEAMRRVLGVDADDAVKTKTTASFESIRDVVRAKRVVDESIPLEATVEQVRDALRDAGALKVSEFKQYKWVAPPKPKRQKKAG